jgi:hypothetical protein
MLRSNPKPETNTRFGVGAKPNINQEEKEPAISDSDDMNSKYDLTQINAMKQ